MVHPSVAVSLGLALLAPAAVAAESRYLADLTGDGLPDLLRVASDGMWSVAVQTGARRFVPVEQELPAVAVSGLLVTDLDGDGWTDLYLLTAGPGSALRGDGRGRFFEATEALGLSGAGPAQAAERQDVDGDGRPDLLLHGPDGDELFWAEPAGGFARAAETPPGAEEGAASAGMLPPGALRVLRHMSLVELDDGTGNALPTIRFTGVNVQIVNGLGATNGNPAEPYALDAASTATNGLGNLVVGYNEASLTGPEVRTGSHTVVLGQSNGYTGFGGLVAGTRNTQAAAYASIVGGSLNVASGLFSVVSAGTSNTASGDFAAVAGGTDNRASGLGAAVSGGWRNTSDGSRASVAGGVQNRAEDDYSAISGGAQNRATGRFTSVSGGLFNNAASDYATVSGGKQRTATGIYDWAAGALIEDS